MYLNTIGNSTVPLNFGLTASERASSRFTYRPVLYFRTGDLNGSSSVVVLPIHGPLVLKLLRKLLKLAEISPTNRIREQTVFHIVLVTKTFQVMSKFRDIPYDER